MPATQRVRERASLLFKFGQVLDPVLLVNKRPESYGPDERERIRARAIADLSLFGSELGGFVRRGYTYRFERNEDAVMRALRAMRALLKRTNDFGDAFIEGIEARRKEVFDAIVSVPDPISDPAPEAESPFAAYCLLRDACSTAGERIIWLDRSFDQSVFHLYFVDVTPSAEITLVTLPQSQLKTPEEQARYSAFLDVSRRFARERGPTAYRLVANPNFRDRWLRCDQRLFAIGDEDSSIVRSIASTGENLKHFENAVSRGVELFGQRCPTHPRGS